MNVRCRDILGGFIVKQGIYSLLVAKKDTNCKKFIIFANTFIRAIAVQKSPTA